MTAKIQSTDPWDIRADDWAVLQVPARPLVSAHVPHQAGVTSGARLLDISCGAGDALHRACDMGAIVTGLNRSKALVSIARQRVPQARIVAGEMEYLPVADQSFEVVKEINTFQSSCSLPVAWAEAPRVCRHGGSVFMLVWGARENNDLQHISLAPILLLLTPMPDGAALPLDGNRIKGAMQQVGLKPVRYGEI